MGRIAKGAIIVSQLIGLAMAQAPTGSIAGVVHDFHHAAVAGAQVRAVSVATRLARAMATPEQGDYSFPALPPGDYEVTVEAPGFRRTVRRATVEAGVTTTIDFDLTHRRREETVTVESADTADALRFPRCRRRGHTRANRRLPLNGRSFLELAKLEPGVQAPSRTNSNRTLVPVLGAPGVNVGGPRFTVDGGSITSVGVGGSQMGLSQEVVQEFQVSTVNFDLSTGIASAGGINVVTRSGGNDLHGTAFYFFRDHTLSAYPALHRDLA